MKAQIFSFVICLSASLTIQAQTSAQVVNENEAMAMVATTNQPVKAAKANVMSREASFPGGMTAMTKFLKKNIKYAEIAKENCFEGTVVVKFTVNQDGSLADFHVVKSDNSNLNEQAISIVKSMPNWEPAVNEGYYTNRKIMIPIQFNLR